MTYLKHTRTTPFQHRGDIYRRHTSNKEVRCCLLLYEQMCRLSVDTKLTANQENQAQNNPIRFIVTNIFTTMCKLYGM